jgi:hypothetical protein
MDDDDLSIMRETNDGSLPTTSTSSFDFAYLTKEEPVGEPSPKKILRLQKPTMKTKIGGAWKSITGRSKRRPGHGPTAMEGIID